MRRWLLVLAALLGLVWAGPALAWGEAGHRAIAEIALANVKPATAARIAGLLRAEAGLTTPECRVKSLGDASIWPDCLRGDPARWSYTFPWHYQDEAICGRFDIHSHCAHGDCVTAQIARDRRILADRHVPAAQRLQALAFLTHFIGDIHMPLHAADHGDHGGNSVTVANAVVEPGSKYPTVSLHWFWDKTMAERALAARPALVRRYRPAEQSRIATGEVADWARESYVYARTVLYPRAFHHDPCVGGSPAAVRISEAEVVAAVPFARARLVQAGLRLARVLDAALG